MKILFINPPNPENYVSNKDTMGGFGQLYKKTSSEKVPPLDLFYAASLLRKKGLETEILDYLVDDKPGEKINKSEWDVIAVRMSLPSFYFDLKFIKNNFSDTNSQIIPFGPCLRILYDKIFELSFIETVITGEIEFILPEYLTNSKMFDKGILKKIDNKIIGNPDLLFSDNLDELIEPAWDLVSYNSYKCPTFFGDEPCLFIITSRGCPFKCGYCPYTMNQGEKYRTRTIEKIIEEIKHVVSVLNVKNIFFRDPEFTLQKNRVIDLCKIIINENIKFKWCCETRFDTLSEDLIEIMSKAGCVQINLGIESVNEEVLIKSKRKLISAEKINKMLQCCKSNNIRPFLFFILGLPGESEKQVLATIDFSNKIKPSITQFGFAIPYPGTELYHWAKERNFIYDYNYENYTGFNIVMRNEKIDLVTYKRIIKYLNFVSFYKEKLYTSKMEYFDWIKYVIKLIYWKIKHFFI